MNDPETFPACTFCGVKDGRPVVAAKSQAATHICSPCAALAMSILEDDYAITAAVQRDESGRAVSASTVLRG
jgi:hypothetical protein